MELHDMSDLLDQLRSLSGCSYISDLHMARYAKEVRSAIKKIDPSGFTLWAWNSAIRYITAEDCRAQTQLDALRFLDFWLASREEKSKHE